jgi:hypothetical protein
MVELALGADEFLEVFEPAKGRPLDVALDEAVRALLNLIEDRLGAKIRIQWNKRFGRPPERASDGARLLIAVLQATEGPPAQTALLIMVKCIRNGRVPAGPSHLVALFRAHFDELDASLLPDRHAGKTA